MESPILLNSGRDLDFHHNIKNVCEEEKIQVGLSKS